MRRRGSTPPPTTNHTFPCRRDWSCCRGPFTVPGASVAHAGEPARPPAHGRTAGTPGAMTASVSDCFHHRVAAQHGPPAPRAGTRKVRRRLQERAGHGQRKEKGIFHYFSAQHRHRRPVKKESKGRKENEVFCGDEDLKRVHVNLFGICSL